MTNKQTLQKKQKRVVDSYSQMIKPTTILNVLLFFLVLINEVDPCCSRWPGGPENSMHELVMSHD
jgi:hypothetical protein